MARVFDTDPITNTTKLFHYNPSDDTFVIETKQDVEDLVEWNKALRNATERSTPWGDGQTVAQIPMALYFELRAKGIIDPEGNTNDDAAFLRWLDDPANLAWRTRVGSVSR